MRADHCKFRLIQATFLHQNTIGHSNLADIVQGRGKIQPPAQLRDRRLEPESVQHVRPQLARQDRSRH